MDIPIACDVCGVEFNLHPDNMVETKVEVVSSVPATELSFGVVGVIATDPMLMKFATGAMCICFKCQAQHGLS